MLRAPNCCSALRIRIYDRADYKGIANNPPAVEGTSPRTKPAQGPGRCRNCELFVAEGDHWIDAGSATSRDELGNKSYCSQEQRDGAECGGVGRIHAEEQ